MHRRRQGPCAPRRCRVRQAGPTRRALASTGCSANGRSRPWRGWGRDEPAVLSPGNERRLHGGAAATNDCAKVLMQPAERAANGELEREIAGLITEALNLDVQPQDIESDAPLYRDGLGL